MPNKTRDQSPGLPSSVVVNFTSTWNDDGPTSAAIPIPYAVTVPIATVIGAATAGTGASSSLKGVAGRSKSFFDSCQALFTNAGGATPTNDDALQTLAKRIATDFYAWRVLGWDRVIAGIVGHAQDGYTDSVEWSYTEGEGSPPSTRAIARIGDDDPEELMHSDAPPWLPTAQMYEVISTTMFAKATSADQMMSGTVAVRTMSYTGALTTVGAKTFKAWQKDTSTGGAVSVGENMLVSRDNNGKYIISWRQC
jgi:hypothetical protein